MEKCRLCSSYAINPGHDGREKHGEGVDLDLCNVCYWRIRAELALVERAHYGDIMTTKLGIAEARVEELEEVVTWLREDYFWRGEAGQPGSCRFCGRHRSFHREDRISQLGCAEARVVELERENAAFRGLLERSSNR